MKNESNLKLREPSFRVIEPGIASSAFMTGYQQYMNECAAQAWFDFDRAFREYLSRCLAGLGYVFDSDEAFEAFVKARVSSITIEDRPNDHELYLDFVNVLNKGTLIGCYSDKIDVQLDGNKATITIG